MIANQKYRINAMAKDFNLKSKDLIDLLAAHGIEGKTHMAVLEPHEFDLLFEELTKANQTESMGDYLDGKADIPQDKKVPDERRLKKEAAEKAAAEKAAAEKAAAEKAAAEKAAAEKAAAEKAAAEKAAAEKAAAEKAAAEKAAAEKAAAEKAAAEKAAAEKAAAEKVAAEKAAAKPFAPSDRPQQNFGGFAPRTPQNTMNGQRSDSRGDFARKPYAPQGDNRYNNANSQGRGFDPNRSRGNGFPPKNDRFGNNASRPQRTTAPKPKIELTRGEAVRTGETRIIDTRSVSVDLSKYDEKFETLASSTKGSNTMAPQKQKLKKQNNRPQSKADKERMNMDKLRRRGPEKPVKKQPLSITVPDEITVGELASRLKVTAAEVVKRLMLMGMMASVNQVIDYDTAYLVADELGAICTKEVVVTIEEKLFDESEDAPEDLTARSPVVVVMGHVDHGKTSLLDAIRNTHVTAGEAGGITQHIGAYKVSVNGRDITFLDTPGHAAFTAMRLRGAMATDIAIIVVAADDGIMPQTVEAINHAKAAGVSIIVAINKMDKPGANPDVVKQELTKYDLIPEEWGGDTICVPVSALTHKGIDELLEMVLLVADMKELKANPNRRAKGVVIEAKLDRGRGAVATLLVQNGTLHVSDILIAGTAVGRVRAMTNENGRRLQSAGPSTPVEITGLAEVPIAGDEFNVVADERMARELAEQRRSKEKEDMFKANAKASLDDLFAQIAAGVKELNIIVKADVAGSVEAVKASLVKLSNEEVKVKIVHSAVGGITENDVMLANAANAIIIGFNVRPDKSALDDAAAQGVEIRTYRVIYECIEEIEAAIKGMLAPTYKEVLLGHAEVRQVIHVPNVGSIAGSYLQDGKVTRQSKIRVVRDGIVIFEDAISSLRRFKDDVKEVAQGYECGIGLEKFNDIKEGDILEAYIMEEVKR